VLRETTESLPQRLLVTLLAEFKAVTDGAVPSSILVNIFQDFGISVDATRTALSRLVAKSIFVREKSGRTTAYALSTSAAEIVRQDREKILSFGLHQQWDGHWTLVAFSVAEAQRERRHALRSNLRGLGFAPLFDGLWGAAFATEDDVRAALDSAQVTDSLIIRGEIKSLGVSIEQFHQVWKLDDIEGQYKAFIDGIQPIVTRAIRGDIAPAEALLLRTRIMDDWRAFPIKEPDLPDTLLPSNWPREQARNLFIRAYEMLKEPANIRLKMLLATG
jgi:phenylacetic acid degradation operon negative regulatory protein